MSQIASFYLLKDGQRQELSGGGCSGAVYMAIWDWCESELDLDVDVYKRQAQRWMELDPEDENAPAVIRECKAEIRKRQRSRNKKAKFVPGDTPFEGFDLTGFWDDSMYALKEYVSDPPSDELIASVEEELGYKLPAAYIWLIPLFSPGSAPLSRSAARLAGNIHWQLIHHPFRP